MASSSWNDFKPSRQAKTATSPLPAEQYVAVTAKRLTRARVLWVNVEYFRELGFQIPNKEISPELSEILLDLFAYGIPSPDDQPESFGKKEITLYADRYTGRKRGSGRAASFLSAIPVQSKGPGITPLGDAWKSKVKKNQPVADHANGKASVDEGVREAIWGELNFRNLPYGGNRVLALISRGTDSDYPHDEHHSDVIIIREDPLRPAHFMSLTGETLKTYNFKVNKVETYEKLAAAIDPQFEGEKKHIGEMLYEYVDRVAAQYARTYAGINYFHGATSISNIEVSGRFLDYGTQTTQNGRGFISVLDHQESARDVDEIKRILVKNFIEGVSMRLPDDVEVPDADVMLEQFDEAYLKYSRFEYLKLIGLPVHLAEKFLQTKNGKRLADELEHIATTGAYPYSGKQLPPDELVTSYDFPKIIDALSIQDEEQRTQKLKKLIDQKEDRPRMRSLIKVYDTVMSEALEMAKAEGVKTKVFRKFVRIASQERNKPNVGLARSEMFRELRPLVKAFETEDSKISIRQIGLQSVNNISDYINQKVQNNRRDEDLSHPWQIVFDRSYDDRELFKGMVYDALSDMKTPLKSTSGRLCKILF